MFYSNQMCRCFSYIENWKNVEFSWEVVSETETELRWNYYAHGKEEYVDVEAVNAFPAYAFAKKLLQPREFSE